MQFSCIEPIDRTLSGATTPGQNGPRSDGNEGVIHIPQSSNITKASLIKCLVSYTGHFLEESYQFSREAVSVFCSTLSVQNDLSIYKLNIIDETKLF